MKSCFKHSYYLQVNIEIVIMLFITGGILSCKSQSDSKYSFHTGTDFISRETSLPETLALMEDIPDSTLAEEKRFYSMEECFGNLFEFSMTEESLWAESSRLFKSWLVDTIKNIPSSPSSICSQQVEIWDDSTQMSIIKTFDLEISVKRKSNYPQEIEATLCTLQQYNQLKKEPFHLHLVTTLWCWPSPVLLSYDFAQTWEECILTYKEQVISYDFIRGDLRSKYIIENGVKREVPYEEWEVK